MDNTATSSPKCPYCGISLSSSRTQFCRCCKNQISETAASTLFAFSATDAYINLQNAYNFIVCRDFNNAQSSISSINAIRSQEPNIRALNNALYWGRKLIEWNVSFNSNGGVILGSITSSAATQSLTEKKISEIESAQNDKNLNTEQQQALGLILDALEEGFGVCADNLVRSCEVRDRETGKRKFNSTYCRTASKRTAEEFFIFISAVMSKKDNNGKAIGEETFECLVARALKEQLHHKKIGAFWWENDPYENEWQASTQIATGLALSSILVGFAFDTASKDSDGYAQYDCLLQNSPQYSKSLNYEFKKFHELKGIDNDDAVSETAKSFVKGEATITDKKGKERKKKIRVLSAKKLPVRKELRLFTIGKPFEQDYSKYGNLFDKKDERLVVVNPSGANQRERIKSVLKVTIENLYDLIKSYFPQELARLQKREGCYDNVFREWFLELIETETISKEEEPFDPESDLLFKPDAADNTPGDYFFEYAVVDEWGKSAKDHFVFFLEKTYDGYGLPRMSICAVLKDWNYAFRESIGLRQEALKVIQSQINTTDIAKTLKDARCLLANYQEIVVYQHSGVGEHQINSSDRSIRKGYVDYTKEDCRFTIEEEATIGLTGKIILSKKRSSATELPDERVFDFSVNFVQKTIIRYTVDVQGDGISLFIKSKIPQNLEVRVVAYRESVPCLVDHKAYAKWLDKTIGKITEVLTLTPGDSRKKIKIPVAGVKGNMQYRIRLRKNSDKRHFLLHDETEWFLAEKDTKRADRFGRMFDQASRELHCPYCASKLCNPNSTSNIGNFGQGILFCDGSKSDFETGLRNRILCKRNDSLSASLVLPEGYEDSRSAIVTMIGTPNAGKSVFVSRLFGFDAVGEEKIVAGVNSAEADYRPKDVNVSAAYISNALKPFVRDVSFLHPSVAAGKGKESPEMWKQLFGKGILTHYCALRYSHFVKRTAGDSGTVSALQKLPLILSMSSNVTDNSCMVFYDAPGSSLEAIHENTIKNTPIEFTDCIILLVNDDETRDDSVETTDDAVLSNISGASKMLRDIMGQQTNEQIARGGVINNVALAVVLCKFDKFEKEFDINSFVRSLAPMRNQETFKGSELERYIDFCSLEIESYLAKKQGRNATSLLAHADKFAYKKFFAVSSVGRSDSITGIGNDAKTVFFTNPRGIENAILWLSYQSGIIE